MAITKEDLRDFIRFADEKLENGGAGSLVELVCEWEAQRSADNSNGANPVIEIDPESLQKLAKAFPDTQSEQQAGRAVGRRGGVTTAEMIGKAVLAAARAARK